MSAICLVLAAVVGGLTIGSGDSVTVVVPSDPHVGVADGLREAGQAVCDVLSESVGARARLVTDVPKDCGKGGRIFVGGVWAAAAGLSTEGFRGFDNAIAEKDGDVYLYGSDRAGSNPKEWEGCVLPSARAAVRFMERFAGAAFLMPGKTGREVAKVERIAVPCGLRDRESPAFDFGAGRYPGGIVTCMASGIVGYGAYHTYGGHTYPAACPRRKYFKDHPEYFAMKNGRRTWGSSDGCQAYCISNPEFQELVYQELLKRYDAGAEVCQLGQHDGWEVCDCEACEKLYGTGKDWGEKLWCFHRDLAKRLLKDRPGKKVQIMCYAMTADPPKSFREFPENVVIELCKYSDRTFEQWKDHRVPGGFTVYLYLWGNYPFPGYVAKHSFVYLAKLVRRLRENGVRGVYRCGYGDLFGMEGPAYWVFNRTLFDSAADPNRLVEDYCRFAYGPAAEAMSRFHLTLDARIRMMDLIREDNHLGDGVPGGAPLADAVPHSSLDLTAYVYSAETVKRLDGLLSRAEGTEGLSARQKKRLELVRLEYEYAKNLGSIATFYEAYRKSPSAALFGPLGDAVLERNAMLERIFDKNDNPRRLTDWPELRPFGGVKRPMLAVNGRLSAILGAPLSWDIPYLREKGILPGSCRKEADVPRIAQKPPFPDFESGEWADVRWNDLGGIQLQPIPYKARFKTAYDADNLYVAVESDLPDDYKVAPKGRDSNVWSDDCCEVLVDPTGTRDIYYHVIWSPNDGSVYDGAFGLITDPLDPNYNKEYALWNGEWLIENNRAGNKWRTLVAIPFRTLGASTPKPGERYCINVGRTAMFPTAKTTEDADNALWSPNLESATFMSPDAMGTLTFR